MSGRLRITSLIHTTALCLQTLRVLFSREDSTSADSSKGVADESVFGNRAAPPASCRRTEGLATSRKPTACQHGPAGFTPVDRGFGIRRRTVSSDHRQGHDLVPAAKHGHHRREAGGGQCAFLFGVLVSKPGLHRREVQWRGLKEFQRRAGYVSALIFPPIVTNGRECGANQLPGLDEPAPSESGDVVFRQCRPFSFLPGSPVVVFGLSNLQNLPPRCFAEFWHTSMMDRRAEPKPIAPASARGISDTAVSLRFRNAFESRRGNWHSPLLFCQLTRHATHVANLPVDLQSQF